MAENMPTLAAPSELAKAFGEAKIEIEKIEVCKVFFSGGLLKKPMPLTTRQLIVRNGKRIFVKMVATEPWLRIAVTGQKHRGKLPRITLWTTLKRFVQKACKGELDTLAVAEEVGDEYDPMQEIENTLDEQHPRSRGGGGPLGAHQPSNCLLYTSDAADE